MSRFRPELEGIRAIAVLTTMWNHAGFSGLSGSGIDFFFVISGFLVTSIAIRRRERGSFSVRDFYLRRLRRILPALLAVMLITIPFAAILMLPAEFENYGQSLVATLVGGNNVLLYLTTGYWDTVAEFKPLLTTWSLGVEEQFYVLFPLVFLVSHRIPGRLRVALLGTAIVVSLAVSVQQGLTDPDAAFYLMPSRAWEVLVGCLVSVGLARRWRFLTEPPARVGRVLALLGLILALVSLVAGSRGAGFRTPVLFLAVLGVALVIAYAQPGSVTTRVLSWRPLLWIGSISYGVFLWHQPLFVFARVVSPQTPAPWVFILLMLATVAIAWLSHRVVEVPFRRTDRMPLKRFVPPVAAAAVTVLTCGLLVNSAHGFPSRLGESPADASVEFNRRISHLQTGSYTRPGATHVLVLGDSLSRDLANAVLETYPDAELELRHLSGPTFDVGVCFLAQNPDLVRSAEYREADVVLASIGDPFGDCVASEAKTIERDGKAVFYGGPKNFGDNLNWVFQRPRGDRQNLTNALPAWVAALQSVDEGVVPSSNFVSWAPAFEGRRVPITDGRGRLLSPDRVHFTRAGAHYFGARAFPGTALDRFFSVLSD